MQVNTIKSHYHIPDERFVTIHQTHY